MFGSCRQFGGADILVCLGCRYSDIRTFGSMSTSTRGRQKCLPHHSGNLCRMFDVRSREHRTSNAERKDHMRAFLISLGFMLSVFLLVSCEEKPQATATKSGYIVFFSQCNNAEPYRAAQNEKITELWNNIRDVRFAISDAQQDANKQIEQSST